MVKITNKIDRSSLNLPLFFKKFLDAPNESDKNDVGIYIVGNNKSGEFESAVPGSIAVYDRSKSNWNFISPKKYLTEIYCLDEKQWYKCDGSSWNKINNKPIEHLAPNINDFGELIFIEDYIYIQPRYGQRAQSNCPNKPLYPTEYKIYIHSLTDTKITDILSCEYLGDNGTRNGMFPNSINGNCKWIASANLADLNGTYLCKNHPWLVEFKGGTITKTTDIDKNFFAFCRKSQQLLSVYMFDLYKKADGTKIDDKKYMQVLTIGNRRAVSKHANTIILDLDEDSKTIPEYIELFYPIAQETDPSKLDKYWSDRGFYITDDGALGSNWELITVNRTITQQEADSKSLILNNYPMDDCAILLSCAGVDQYEGLDFTINRDTKTISWDGLGLNDIVKKDDVFVITYVTADKDR